MLALTIIMALSATVIVLTLLSIWSARIGQPHRNILVWPAIISTPSVVPNDMTISLIDADARVTRIVRMAVLILKLVLTAHRKHKRKSKQKLKHVVRDHSHLPPTSLLD
jgi:hypothetical protein